MEEAQLASLNEEIYKIYENQMCIRDSCVASER